MNYIIVTNTYKRPADLVLRSLRASISQRIKPYKVFLIDQNQSELVLPDDITSNEKFVRVKTDKTSVSAARNSLTVPENVEWIFFCDDDGYPCEDYSEKLEKTISENPSLEILAGSIIREDNNEYYTLRHKKGGSMKYFRYSKNLMGSNFVIKADTFDKLGRFDENFGVGSYWRSSEETDFCWKAYFAGIKMEYFPELKVFHIPPFNLSVKKGFAKAFNYGIGKGALVYKWLIKKRKLKVSFELIEMFIVPVIQSVRAVFILKPQLILTNIAAAAGRVYGFIKAFFVMK
jgi:GT2 family glycosyltransferase